MSSYTTPIHTISSLLSSHIDHKSLCDIYHAINETTDGSSFVEKIHTLISNIKIYLPSHIDRTVVIINDEGICCDQSVSVWTAYCNSLETQYTKYKSVIDRIWFQFYSSETLYQILTKIQLLKYYNGFDLIYLFYIMAQIKINGIDSYLSKTKHLTEMRHYDSSKSYDIDRPSIIIGEFKKYSNNWSKIFFIINILPGIDQIGFNKFIGFYHRIINNFFCHCTECNVHAEDIYIEWARINTITTTTDKTNDFNPKYTISNFPMNHICFSLDVFNLIKKTIKQINERDVNIFIPIEMYNEFIKQLECYPLIES
jgi:hypothetical protein